MKPRKKMQIKKLMRSWLIATLILFLNEEAYAEVKDIYLPQELLVLKLPDNEAAQWKSINRSVTSTDALVEFIPCKQTSTDWIDLIAVQYLNLSNKKLNSIDEILGVIEQSTINRYPDSKVTWNIIEKKQDEAIYEWILHSQSGNIPPQHEIARIFYHKNNVHRIGFTHRNEIINDENRNKWIHLLSESVFISQTDRRFPSEELSLIVRPFDLIDYGSSFSNWQILNNWMLKDSFHSFTLVPPEHNVAYISECLEIMSTPIYPHCKILTMDQVFLIEKNRIKKKLGKEPKCKILKKTTKEIVYTHQYPQDHLIVTEVVKVRVTPNVYLSIYYKKGLSSALSHEKILEEKKRIEAIKYKEM